MEDECGDINDICDYLETPVCCHPDYNAGEVTKGYCLKCSHRAVPVKLKAITLLRDLMIAASNTGYCTDQYLNTDGKIKDLKATLNELSEKVTEVEKFLTAIGVDVVNHREIDKL